MVRRALDVRVHLGERDAHPDGAPLDGVILHVDGNEELDHGRLARVRRGHDHPGILARPGRFHVRGLSRRMSEGVPLAAVGRDLPFLVVDHHVGQLGAAPGAGGRLAQRDVVVGEERGRGEPRDAVGERESLLARLAEERVGLVPDHVDERNADEPDDDQAEREHDPRLEPEPARRRRINVALVLARGRRASQCEVSPWRGWRFRAGSLRAPRRLP